MNEREELSKTRDAGDTRAAMEAGIRAADRGIRAADRSRVRAADRSAGG